MGQEPDLGRGTDLGYDARHDPKQIVVDFELLKTLATVCVLCSYDAEAMEYLWGQLMLRDVLSDTGGVEGRSPLVVERRPATPDDLDGGEVIMDGKRFKMLAGFVMRQIELSRNLLTIARSAWEAFHADARNFSMIAAAYGYTESAALVELASIEPMLPTEEYLRDHPIPESLLPEPGRPYYRSTFDQFREAHLGDADRERWESGRSRAAAAGGSGRKWGTYEEARAMVNAKFEQLDNDYREIQRLSVAVGQQLPDLPESTYMDREVFGFLRHTTILKNEVGDGDWICGDMILNDVDILRQYHCHTEILKNYSDGMSTYAFNHETLALTYGLGGTVAADEEHRRSIHTHHASAQAYVLHDREEFEQEYGKILGKDALDRRMKTLGFIYAPTARPEGYTQEPDVPRADRGSSFPGLPGFPQEKATGGSSDAGTGSRASAGSGGDPGTDNRLESTGSLPSYEQFVNRDKPILPSFPESFGRNIPTGHINPLTFPNMDGTWTYIPPSDEDHPQTHGPYTYALKIAQQSAAAEERGYKTNFGVTIVGSTWNDFMAGYMALAFAQVLVVARFGGLVKPVVKWVINVVRALAALDAAATAAALLSPATAAATGTAKLLGKLVARDKAKRMAAIKFIWLRLKFAALVASLVVAATVAYYKNKQTLAMNVRRYMGVAGSDTFTVIFERDPVTSPLPGANGQPEISNREYDVFPPGTDTVAYPTMQPPEGGRPWEYEVGHWRAGRGTYNPRTTSTPHAKRVQEDVDNVRSFVPDP